MITLDFSSLEKITDSHGISRSEMEEQSSRIVPFLENIRRRNQGFYRDEVLAGKKLMRDIESFSHGAREKFESVVVLGIGGSALGIHTLKEAFGNSFSEKTPALYILDNIDPSLIAECRARINLSKTLFLVITKSGSTPETISQYFYFKDEVEKAGLPIKDHFVFITDPENGFLRKEAERENVTSFPVPENVGGRFSVLTSVGLLPALLLGIDAEKLLSGAIKMKNSFLSRSFADNLPFQIAAIQYLLSKKGKTITVMMPYAEKLFRFADWYRQLLAESIGKARDEKGKEVHVGITPVNALGATDQHSQSQLYMEGPFDKLIMFLEVEDLTEKPLPIPVPGNGEKEFHYLKGVDFGSLLRTEKRATSDALTKADRPNITLRIPKIDEENLGALFLLFEGSVAFLGEFFGINAFDQPGVELSKKLTKEYLSGKKE